MQTGDALENLAKATTTNILKWSPPHSIAHFYALKVQVPALTNANMYVIQVNHNMLVVIAIRFFLPLVSDCWSYLDGLSFAFCCTSGKSRHVYYIWRV